jgi:hypothetical protein
MIAHASQFRSLTVQRHAQIQVRYAAPDDLLPWADPYIASLFAGSDEPQAELQRPHLQVDDDLPFLT